MKFDPRPWLRRIGFLPWGLGFLLFLGYVIALGEAVTGQSNARNSWTAWLLMWSPMWIAFAFGQRSMHSNQLQRDEEEPLPVSTGVVGTCTALAAFGVALLWAQQRAVMKLGLPDEMGLPPLMSIVLLALAGFMVSRVPDVAVRAGRFNAAQTRRLRAKSDGAARVRDGG